jgi:asparaginyl-tRNA synthetase
MLEAEMAFVDGVGDVMDVAEQSVKRAVEHVLESPRVEDVHALGGRLASSPSLVEQLQQFCSRPFTRITYTEAIGILSNAQTRFQYQPEWGLSLQTEHERFLAETHFGGAVFVTDYPSELKPFYMKLNADGRTAACFDLLVPGVGELVGGSMREDNLNTLRLNMRHKGLCEEEYSWYLDSRRFGSVPHGGFGIGFERLMQFITGMDNIRDTILMPRSFGHCPY